MHYRGVTLCPCGMVMIFCRSNRGFRMCGECTVHIGERDDTCYEHCGERD